MFLRIGNISELKTHLRVLLDAFIPKSNINILVDVSSLESEAHDGLQRH